MGRPSPNSSSRWRAGVDRFPGILRARSFQHELRAISTSPRGSSVISTTNRRLGRLLERSRAKVMQNHKRPTARTRAHSSAHSARTCPICEGRGALSGGVVANNTCCPGAGAAGKAEGTGANEFFYVNRGSDGFVETNRRWQKTPAAPPSCLLPAVRRQADLSRERIGAAELPNQLPHLRGWLTDNDRRSLLALGKDPSDIEKRFRVLPEGPRSLD